MQLLLGAVPIILRLFSKALGIYDSQIIPGIICQGLPIGWGGVHWCNRDHTLAIKHTDDDDRKSSLGAQSLEETC